MHHRRSPLVHTPVCSCALQALLMCVDSSTHHHAWTRWCFTCKFPRVHVVRQESPGSSLGSTIPPSGTARPSLCGRILCMCRRADPVHLPAWRQTALCLDIDLAISVPFEIYVLFAHVRAPCVVRTIPLLDLLSWQGLVRCRR